MDRKEFLSTFGMSIAAVACAYCLGGCNSQSNTVTGPPTNVDFTLDLTDPANAALKTAGGYLYHGGLIVAHTTAGPFVALSQVCTHAGGTVQYQASGNFFHCPNHGSNFGTDGSVLNGPAGSPLAKYNTTLTGNSLRVFS